MDRATGFWLRAAWLLWWPGIVYTVENRLGLDSTRRSLFCWQSTAEAGSGRQFQETERHPLELIVGQLHDGLQLSVLLDASCCSHGLSHSTVLTVSTIRILAKWGTSKDFEHLRSIGALVGQLNKKLELRLNSLHCL